MNKELAKARRAGEVKPRPCERCGATENVEAHHEDYFRPLDVIWLCHKHHGGRHAEINRAFRLKMGIPNPREKWEKYNKVAAALSRAGELSVKLITDATGLNKNEVANVLMLWRRERKVMRENRGGSFVYRLTA